MIRFIRDHFKESIVILMVVALVLVLGALICGDRLCNCSQCDTVINAVTAFATFLNAILLFYTLKHSRNDTRRPSLIYLINVER